MMDAVSTVIHNTTYSTWTEVEYLVDTFCAPGVPTLKSTKLGNGQKKN